MKHKKLFITATVIFTVIVFLSIFITIWFWGDKYKNFNDFRMEFEIPGLDEGACPQGMGNFKGEYDVKDENGNPVLDENGKQKTAYQEYFFISAYMKEGASRIYVMGDDTGYVGFVSLKNTDGSDYTGHAGGVATNGYTLWVVSDDTVFVAKTGSSAKDNIAYDLIKAAENNGEIKFTASFAANCNASFCYFYNDDGDASNSSYYNDRLYVGEFYRDGNYPTAQKHHVTTNNGDKNTAFVYEYRISTLSTNKYGLETLSSSDSVPEKSRVPKIQNIFSITDEIQGFARTKTGLTLSQSYGLKNSNILYYEWSEILKTANSKYYKDFKYTDADGNEKSYGGFESADAPLNSGANYRDTDLRVYFVDNAVKRNSYSIPSMSEGLCVKGDRVYVLFESAAYKYRPFVRQVLKNVYSIVPKAKA